MNDLTVEVHITVPSHTNAWISTMGLSNDILRTRAIDSTSCSMNYNHTVGKTKE